MSLTVQTVCVRARVFPLHYLKRDIQSMKTIKEELMSSRVWQPGLCCWLISFQRSYIIKQQADTVVHIIIFTSCLWLSKITARGCAARRSAEWLARRQSLMKWISLLRVERGTTFLDGEVARNRDPRILCGAPCYWNKWVNIVTVSGLHASGGEGAAAAAAATDGSVADCLQRERLLFPPKTAGNNPLHE